jgi:prepilin-type N-terminal cleavage/methylation domain-containing protein
MMRPTAITHEVSSCAWLAMPRRARGQHSHSRCARSPQRGFTLVELLVVILIIGVLSGLLLSVISSVRRRARNVQCLSNLRQLSVVFRSYAEAHRGRFPTGEAEEWFIEIARQGELPQEAFQCPDDPDAGGISYEWRDDFETVPPASLAGKRIDLVADSDLILVFDHASGWHSPDQINAATVGGQAQSYSKDEFQINLLRSVSSGEAFYLDD